MPVGAQHSHPYFELEFRPNVVLVSVVRRFVADFFNQVLSDPDAVSRVALATHELLENAVRHATDGVTTIRIDLEPADEGDCITIRLTNRAPEEKRKELVALFEEMRSISNPHEHYRTLMRRYAKRTEGSGLGLARIRAEAEMLLDYGLDDDRVTITASTTVAVRKQK
jgi:anti-sigma regulatory factor (Ser/Thr protein kinase)